jgi:hypothetical protein
MSQRSVRTALAAALVGITTIAPLAAASASSSVTRPSPGVDTTAPVERPVRPTPAPRPIPTIPTGPAVTIPSSSVISGGTLTTTPRILTGFAVTTDSVVATATVNYTGTPPITIRWGDGTQSQSSLLPMLTVDGVDPATAPGTMTFKHEYAAPADGSAFQMVVTAQVGNESDARIITVTPRYRVNQYQASFSPTNHCEPVYETYGEYTITESIREVNEQTSQSTVTQLARWDRDIQTMNTILPQFNVLPGSHLVREYVMADAHDTVTFSATERDTFYDDSLGSASIDLHPSLGSRHLDLTMSSDCSAALSVDVDVTLLKPGLPTGGSFGTISLP